MKIALLLVAALSGCSSVAPCFIAHGPSIRVTDAGGATFMQESKTVEFCPGYITPEIGMKVVKP
jgi:uncharacterized protein YceK